MRRAVAKCRVGGVKHQVKLRCQPSVGVGRQQANDLAVRTFFTSSRRPAGPLAPPTRRTASAPAGAPAAAATNAGRLARKAQSPGPPRHTAVTGGSAAERYACSRCPDCPGRVRTCQERLRRRLRRSSTLDRTCPKVPESAAIGSRDRSGSGCLTLKRQQRHRTHCPLPSPPCPPKALCCIPCTAQPC
jgi:hypothetical protein